MDGVVVKAGAVVKRCILAEDVTVGAGAKIGGDGPIAHVGTGLTTVSYTHLISYYDAGKNGKSRADKPCSV